MNIFTAIYFAGIVGQIIIRIPYNTKRKAEKIRERRITAQEKGILFMLFTSILLPLVYAATPWLDFANYKLPPWAGWVGVAFLAGTLFVFWRAHADLGRNWSPTLEIREEHELITRGIYGVIRHPMYASQWLWIIAQPLLLQNWIAGGVGLVTFIPFYFIRVRAEEKMMLDTFGDQYRDYMSKVGGIIPR